MASACVAGVATAAGKMFAASAGTAAAGTAAAAEVFDYNRENFMEDREQRMKKEFQERKMRVKQADVWREDVRDFVSLTERKMKYYLLVNVLLLGFNVNLWCEGRLPETVPRWLMMGNQIATGGSFLFLLLTVWLSMHAAVAAQSYQARVLTQLVRLPLPTWAELEACRTYASEFESLEPRQMFRVPFFSSSQERIAAKNAGRGGPPRANNVEAPVGAAADAPESRIATDPWGLERRGDDIYELGTQHGKDVAQLRHIKIIRQAAVYWQTYDAFARVSMSVGVNQLMLAMSYYILGYVQCQVRCPAAAFAGVLCLVGTAEVMARIDLTLPVRQQRLIQVLLVAGPGVACLAAYYWGLEYDFSKRIAKGLAPLAFVSHGAVLALMTLFLRVAEQQNGAMMPLAFQGVLYLDVFGWMREEPAKSLADSEATPQAPGKSLSQADLTPASVSSLPSLASHARAHAAQPQARPSPKSRPAAGYIAGSGGESGNEGGPLGYYAMDYLCDDATESDSERSSEHGANSAKSQRLAEQFVRPAVAAVSYGADGRPVPVRPDDLAPAGAYQDMRHVPGAPKMWEVVSAVDAPAKDFFEPVTFMPPESRRRCKEDGFFEEGRFRQSPNKHDDDDDLHIETGHDNESPGLMPWTIFRSSAVLLCLVWMFAAAVTFEEIMEFRSNIHPWWVVSEDSFAHEEATLVAQHARVVPVPGVFQLWAAGLSGAALGPNFESIRVEWPYPSIAPRGLSCDATGSRLVVTDGVSTFAAQLQTDAAAQNAGDAVGDKRLALSIYPTELKVRFSEAASCNALRGEAVLDTSVLCPMPGNATAGRGDCKVLVLHRHGRRVAVCPLESAAGDVAMLAGQQASRGYAISEEWLERSILDVTHSPREQVKWIVADPSCGHVGMPLHEGCASVGTSHGRVVRLQQGVAANSEEQETQPMVPVDVFDERDAEAEVSRERLESRFPGIVRAFNSRYIGVLQPHRMSIRVLDFEAGGAQAGTLLLPAAPGATRAASSLRRQRLRKPRPGANPSADGVHRFEDVLSGKGSGVASFCSGGGHLYILGDGPSPKLWRIAVPRGLWPDGLRSGAEPSSSDVRPSV